MKDGLPTIFVAIASWRDPECQYTVRDLFQKAAHPERVNVGICWQYDPDEDEDCFEVPSPYPYQTQSVACLPQESRGGSWARARALEMVYDEDYVLQIDAHMRFAPGWDDSLIDNIRRCPTEKAGLTTIAPHYWPPDTLEDFTDHLPVSHVAEARGMGNLQPLALSGYMRKFSTLAHIGYDGPPPTPFVVANFLFAPRRMFEEVPYDPYLYFRGQEAAYSLRLWTHGYNLYQPDSVVIYHYWESVARIAPGNASQDYKSTNDRALQAQKRVWHLLGLKPSDDPEILVEIDQYGLGTARTPESFWSYAGVNIHTGAITEDAHFGIWKAQPA